VTVETGKVAVGSGGVAVDKALVAVVIAAEASAEFLVAVGIEAVVWSVWKSELLRGLEGRLKLLLSLEGILRSLEGLLLSLEGILRLRLILLKLLVLL
jgi:hypothetical protein